MGNFVYVLHAVVYFGAMSTRYVALAIIIAVTLNLGMIYRDICDIVEKRLLDISSRDENGSKILLAQGCDMLKRFEQFKWCAEEAEEILGPFVLVTMLASGWMLVTGVHNTLAGSYTGGLSFLVMGEQLIYISLIFLGQYIANMMKLRRKRLQRILTLKPYIRSTSGGKLAHLLIAFNWRLTASNVFDVNRQLLSGIVSNWMNYVVVIFQFQMAMQPKSCVPA
ncbi:uncharacterized protein LOC118436154 [Folsomia candida]|nr:uncharacterized protein LOC118436154 [Folsomia candida]